VNILWVKAGKLLPVDTGGRLRSYHILKELARHHGVTLLSYYPGRPDPQYEAAIRGEFPAAHSICTSAGSSFLRESLNYLRSLPHHAPFAVSKFTHPAVAGTVRRWLDEERFDVAVCDFLSASLNFPSPPPTPTVLFQHNVESSLWQRMAETETHPLRRAAYRLEAVKMVRYESSALGRFHHVIAVSERDRRQMMAMNPSCGISVVPTGVDTRKFAHSPAPEKPGPPRIVFTGSMDWEPNIDAAIHFCQDVLPRVRSEFPQAVFQIVGRNPHAPVKKLACPSVEVTGTVPSVGEYLQNATVVVVPLRVGGGTRLKIFEAMAMGKAVVSTSIGAEGLDVVSGRDLVLADGASDFAKAICLLLRNRALRRKYEQAAMKLACQHDWARAAERFAAVLQLTINGLVANSLVPANL